MLCHELHKTVTLLHNNNVLFHQYYLTLNANSFLIKLSHTCCDRIKHDFYNSNNNRGLSSNSVQIVLIINIA